MLLCKDNCFCAVISQSFNPSLSLMDNRRLPSELKSKQQTEVSLKRIGDDARSFKLKSQIPFSLIAARLFPSGDHLSCGCHSGPFVSLVSRVDICLRLSILFLVIT